LIKNMDSVVLCSKWVLSAARELKMPVIATEQYPKALGSTVKEVKAELEGAHMFEKTQFSMLTETVGELLPDYESFFP